MRKKHFVESWPKRYQVPADVRALGSYGNWIAAASREYYRNRPVHLIRTGRRVIKKKGHSPSNSRV